jgi:hypothetical protein
MRCLCLLTLIVGLAATSNVMADDAPAIPTGVKPLTGPEIQKLLDGRKFEFTAYDEPLVGVSIWNAGKKTVSGSYIWDNKKKGTYETDWIIDGDKNCTRSKGSQFVCQTVYPFGDGFMEVTVGGKVHSVSSPAN